MEEDLISKKDLLEETGISYGQLYRWKRKGLIPDEWFIRKSTFTGQETFFPRSKVLSRIYRIKDMKEDVSLDDLVEVFSPTADIVALSPDELVQKGVVTPEGLKIFTDLFGSCEMLRFDEILYAYVVDQIVNSGDVGTSEAKTVLSVLQQARKRFDDQPCALYLMRKLGVFTCIAVSPPGGVALDDAARLIITLHTTALIEELKLKLL